MRITPSVSLKSEQFKKSFYTSRKKLTPVSVRNLLSVNRRNVNTSIEGHCSYSQISSLIKVPKSVRKILNCYFHKNDRISHNLAMRIQNKSPTRSKTPIWTSRTANVSPRILSTNQISTRKLTPKKIPLIKKSWYLGIINKLISQHITN